MEHVREFNKGTFIKVWAGCRETNKSGTCKNRAGDALALEVRALFMVAWGQSSHMEKVRLSRSVAGLWRSHGGLGRGQIE